MRLVFLFFAFLLFSFSLPAEVSDSLKQAVLNEKDPVKRCDGFEQLGMRYRGAGEFDSCIRYGDLEIMLAKELKRPNHVAIGMMTRGSGLYMKGNYEEALATCLEAMDLCEKNKVKGKVVASLNNLAGTIYLKTGKTEKAIESFENARTLCLERLKKGPDEFATSLFGRLTTNIGTVYAQMGNFKKAAQYYEENAAFLLSIGDTVAYATTLSNVGAANFYLKNYDKALATYFKAKEILTRYDNKEMICRLAENIASVHIERRQFRESEAELNKALPLAQSLHSFELQSLIYNTLYKQFEAEKNLAAALENFILYTAFKDSMLNEGSTKQMNELNTKYETDKKEKQILLLDKEKKLSELETENQKGQRNSILIGLALVVVLLGFVIYGSLQKSRNNKVLESKNKEITLKNHTIEEKNKEILDSINYAKRLQSAILARPEEIRSKLADAFLLYKPKDIVAGDFYFYDESDAFVFVAAADCTGHGVPGALVSVVCSNALSRCVNEMKLSDPAQILNRTRELVLETFSKSDKDVKDGMDISIVVIEKNTAENGKRALKWAGAYNPLWYFSNGQMLELAADKQPVGQTEKMLPFTSHDLHLGSGDSLFLFTDGYADQFGGPKGKKFKSKQLKELLVSFQHETHTKQKEILDAQFNQWKGNLEQVDDVCIIGLKL